MRGPLCLLIHQKSFLSSPTNLSTINLADELVAIRQGLAVVDEKVNSLQQGLELCKKMLMIGEVALRLAEDSLRHLGLVSLKKEIKEVCYSVDGLSKDFEERLDQVQKNLIEATKIHKPVKHVSQSSTSVSPS
ncbi:hypothetical protein CFOL_v3_00394 [Cephalotus follicularis]|uniref:Uncharacterized protein n=1 Tax=Cephalotus follicularis TaxID=3775 RepID=A0A1Q3AMU4_CEPFO|nr:hypothetical protein CFOL_v3_00394 [Cephalotus follicularis]